MLALAMPPVLLAMHRAAEAGVGVDVHHFHGSAALWGASLPLRHYWNFCQLRQAQVQL